MPRIDMETHNISGVGNFQFSAARIDDLEATEYTLVTIALDTSSSVQNFESDYERMMNTIINACKKNPRSENLLVRVITFANDIKEYHGFKLLSQIAPDEYSNIRASGMTALYDAVYTAIGATLNYSIKLIDNNFDVNGIIYIITDGCENNSTSTVNVIQGQIKQIMKSEELKNITTILIGLIDPNDPNDIEGTLKKFRAQAGLTSFINAGDINESNLAKLANFMSQSISSQSQALATGQSANLTF